MAARWPAGGGANSVNIAASRTLTREDWEAAALLAMARGGLAGVHIDEVAQRLDVTKGSFYWHYDGRDELIEAALARWQSASVRELEGLAAIGDPAARLARLVAQWVELPADRQLEVALSGAIDDDRVTRFVEAVTVRRLDLLERTYGELGARNPAARALLAQALLTGYLHTVRVDPLRGESGRALLESWALLGR